MGAIGRPIRGTCASWPAGSETNSGRWGPYRQVSPSPARHHTRLRIVLTTVSPNSAATTGGARCRSPSIGHPRGRAEPAAAPIAVEFRHTQTDGFAALLQQIDASLGVTT